MFLQQERKQNNKHQEKVQLGEAKLPARHMRTLTHMQRAGVRTQQEVNCNMLCFLSRSMEILLVDLRALAIRIRMPPLNPQKAGKIPQMKTSRNMKDTMPPGSEKPLQGTSLHHAK